MSDVAIRTDKLSKSYRIAHSTGLGRYKTLRDDLTSAATAPFRRLRRLASGASDPRRETFWALKDISFEINEGEVVGIIGRNGAGKSTLLKILSRITEPTRGQVEIYGRVGSLLEVGTGFHPELTGRENIYLSGAILGMTRKEVDRKFDEIVAFAEVEKFLDTPAKHYSSGMYVRLAFAVAAHLDPEILLIDEVLAVGDTEFQKKCLGKMGEVAHAGRTVLFVSHQMNAVRTLCNKCLLLSQGQIAYEGITEQVIAHYLQSDALDSEWRSDSRSSLHNPYFSPTRFAIVDQQLQPVTREVQANEEVGVLIEGNTETIDTALTVGFAVYAASGELLYWSLHTDTPPHQWPVIQKGRNRLVCWLPKHFLNEGHYRIELHLSLHFIAWLSQPGVNAPSLHLSIRGGLSDSPYWMMIRPGLLAPVLPFTRLAD